MVFGVVNCVVFGVVNRMVFGVVSRVVFGVVNCVVPIRWKIKILIKERKMKLLTIVLTVGLFFAHFFGLWWSLDTNPAIYLALLMGTPFTGLLTGCVLFPEIRGK